MNAAKLALLAGGAYLLWRVYMNSAALPVAAGSPPAGSPPTPGPAGGAPLGGGTFGTVKLTDNSGANASGFKVGDSWTLTVTGPANSPVMITATQNGASMGTSQLGTTDGNGVFVLTGSWAAVHAGAWIEQVTVGGLPALPVLNFSVLPAYPGAALAGLGQPGHQFTVADLRSAVRRPVPLPILWVRGSDGQIRPAVANARSR